MKKDNQSPLWMIKTVVTKKLFGLFKPTITITYCCENCKKAVKDAKKYYKKHKLYEVVGK